MILTTQAGPILKWPRLGIIFLVFQIWGTGEESCGRREHLLNLQGRGGYVHLRCYRQDEWEAKPKHSSMRALCRAGRKVLKAAKKGEVHLCRLRKKWRPLRDTWKEWGESGLQQLGRGKHVRMQALRCTLDFKKSSSSSFCAEIFWWWLVGTGWKRHHGCEVPSAASSTKAKEGGRADLFTSLCFIFSTHVTLMWRGAWLWQSVI